jgi:hypothetical protein
MSTPIEPERLEVIHTKLVAVAHECVRVINTQPTCSFVVLIGKLPNKGFPRGHCIGSDSRGRFYSYDAKRLLAALVAMGVITVEAHVRSEPTSSKREVEDARESYP